MEQSRHEKTVLEGNAFYELDLDCLSRRNPKLSEQPEIKMENLQKRIDKSEENGVI